MIYIDTPVTGGMILFAIFCILIISVFVISKFSFARLREEHLEDMDTLSDGKKEELRELYQRPERFMNTSTFFILFFIIVLAVYVGRYLEASTDVILQQLGFYDTTYAIVVEWIVLALFAVIVLIFGEIIPKGLALSFPERYVGFSVTIVRMVGKIVLPFVYVAEWIGNTILKTFKAPYRTENDLVHTEEEIRALVSRSHQEGELIDNVFDFVDRIAKEVMIPRQDVVCVYTQDSFEETMHIVSSTSHTRYPLCLEDKDHIIGLVHIKDLMERREEASKDLRSIRRNILVIPEVMKLSVLLQHMRTRRIYQAVVVDEYGGMVGLVGLEDILEELVGDIQDEHERDLPAIVENSNGTYNFAGKVLVDEVEDLLDISFGDVDEDTIGGVIFGMLERTPAVGDVITVDGYTFTVTEMQGYRIERVYAVPVPVEENIDDESN